MPKLTAGKRLSYYLIALVAAVLLLSSCTPKQEEEAVSEENESGHEVITDVKPVKTEKILRYYELRLKVLNEGKVIFKPSEGFYRYGPSILRYKDGSMDVWFSSPGNNSTEWDWITYRHSDDGYNWDTEKVVLRPTKGSRDSCSVCDPAVIFFNNYYYLAYTSTDYAEGKGTNNSAFVARSKRPEGPYEKWNGEGWGGDPVPFIEYDGDPSAWGIGEVSFVIKDEKLYIYYTRFELNGGYTALAKADLSENWPQKLEDKGIVCLKDTNDSLDVVYAEDIDVFLAFSVEDRMAQTSKLVVYESINGEDMFQKEDTTKKYVDDYAHNLGIAKDARGHLKVSRQALVGYAFGKNWGRWSTRFQYVQIKAD